MTPLADLGVFLLLFLGVPLAGAVLEQALGWNR